MERIEVNGVPVRIGTREEHLNELQETLTCESCTRCNVVWRCTSRLVVTEGGRVEMLQVSGTDSCDLHSGDKDADAENAESGMRT